MYQKISYALAVVLFGIVMTGCTTYSYTSRSAAIRGTALSSRALGTEITADFAHKVTATSDPQRSLSAAKNQAIFLCLQQKDVEVVVDPVYEIEYRMCKLRPYKVTVLGFAGKYKQVPDGFDEFVQKNYSKEDIEKYMLLNDPKFLYMYYQKEKKEKDIINQGGDVTYYYINSNDGGSKVKKAPAPKASEQPTVTVSNNKNKKKDSAVKKDKGTKAVKTSFFDLFKKNK